MELVRQHLSKYLWVCMYYKTSGDIKIFDQQIDRNIREVYRKIGYIVETPVFYLDFTVKENLIIYCDYLDCPYSKILIVLDMVGLQNCAGMFVKEMSLGMKQRLAIGRALLADPKLLLLDEPINGLDPQGIKDFRFLMRKINGESGVTILISSHILDEVSKIADTIGIIHEGRVLSQLPID